MSQWDVDCAVIGGGPGGLVSTLYLRRFRRKVVLINHGQSRASWIPRTHNLIGYDRGISGRALLARLRRQIQAVGADICEGEATVARHKDGFKIHVGRSEVKARKVILSTGFEDIHPQLDNLIDLRKRGLLRYCSICDAYEYRNQPVYVLAEDDAGIEKALFIQNWTKQIRILVPESFKPAPQRLKQIRDSGARIHSCRAMTMEPCSNNKGVWIQTNLQRRPLFARVVYVELGCRVRDSAFSGLRGLRRTQAGFMIATTEQRTSVPGLFAVGDCVNLLGQISVAAGQAAVAATTLHNDLL